MKSGCIYCKEIDNGLRKYYYCELSLSGCTYQIKCRGSADEKRKCPEWGPTLEAEKYYQLKLKNDR